MHRWMQKDHHLKLYKVVWVFHIAKNVRDGVEELNGGAPIQVGFWRLNFIQSLHYFKFTIPRGACIEPAM